MSATSDLTTTTTLPTVNTDLMAFARKYVKSRGRDDLDEMNHQNLLRCLQTKNCRGILATAENESELAIAFVQASLRNHVDVVQAFLDNGINVDVKGSLGCTSLMRASYIGNEQCACLLLEHNANVDVQSNDYGSTALMLASNNGIVKITEMLLEKNADVNVEDRNGWTALMFASQRNKKDIVQLLLNHNADIDLKNEHGRKAFDLTKDEEIKELLLNHVTNNNYVLK